MRFLIVLFFLFCVFQVQSQDKWLPQFTGKVEVQKEEIEWLGVDNLYDTSYSQKTLWILKNQDSIFKYITFNPRNSRYDIVNGVQHISFDTLDIERGEYFNWKGDADLPPMLIRNLFSNSGDYFNDVFLKTLGLDSFYENKDKYYLYAENAKFSYEAKGQFLKEDELKIELIYGIPERMDWKRHIYYLKLSQDSLPAKAEWLLDDSLFTEKNLRLYAENGKERMMDQKENRHEMMKEYVARSATNPVELRYFYFVNQKTQAGHTFNSFFAQDSLLLLVFVNGKGINASRHLKLLDYYLKKYPEKKLNYILLVTMEGKEDLSGLSDEFLSHSYRINRYERNRLGMSEANVQIVNSMGKEVYKTGGIAKFHEILNSYW